MYGEHDDAFNSVSSCLLSHLIYLSFRVRECACLSSYFYLSVCFPVTVLHQSLSPFLFVYGGKERQRKIGRLGKDTDGERGEWRGGGRKECAGEKTKELKEGKGGKRGRFRRGTKGGRREVRGGEGNS